MSQNNSVGRNVLKSALLAGTSLFMGMAAPAGEALAQDGASANDEIVVTARRREELLQDVPISITVLNQGELDARGITNIQDMATYVPSLQADSVFGGNHSTFIIRGFSRVTGSAASVAVNFAEVPAPRGNIGQFSGDGSGPGTMFDLQNVQVLRGPQGTLFGRNTVGGVISLVPTMPSDEFEGYIQGEAGDFGMTGAQGVLNVPISDRARFRVGFDQQRRDGYLNNYSGIGPREMNDVDYYAGRASLVLDVTDDIENYTVVQYSNADEIGVKAQAFYCVPGAQTNVLTGGAMCAHLAREQARGDFYGVENDLEDPNSYFQQLQVINRTTWELNENYTLRGIVSYSSLEATLDQSIFGNNALVPNAAPVPPGHPAIGFPQLFATTFAPGYAETVDNVAYTGELQILAEFDRFNFQAGVYYEKTEPDGTMGSYSPAGIACTDLANLICIDSLQVTSGIPNGFAPFVGAISGAFSEVTYENYGIFAQGTYDFTTQLSLTAGVRYTHDEQVGTSQSVKWFFDDAAFGPPVLTTCLNFPAVVLASPDPLLATQCRITETVESDAPTWLLGLDYHATDDVLLYAKYSRGYREGGVNPRAAINHTTYDPEELDSYEVGAKTEFDAGLSGIFNIALFYNDYRDMQVSALYVGAPGYQTLPAVVNAGASTIWGVETELTLRLTDDLRLDVGYAYLNSEVEELEPVTLGPGDAGIYVLVNPQAAVGSPLPRAPENKISVGLSYDFPIPETLGEMTLDGNYTWTDEQFISPDVPYLPEFGVMNLNFNWRHMGGTPVDAGLFVTNALDEQYHTFYASPALGLATRLAAPPRMVGVRLRYNLGGMAE
jgi:iron complex outermembrane receptor protein